MKRMVAVCMLLAYLIGIGTGMSMKVLGVEAREKWIEDETFDEAERQGGAMPCMLVGGNEFPAESETKSESRPVEAPEQTEPEKPLFEYYTVNGSKLSETLQEYLQRQLAARGHSELFPIALCQIYQESRFNSQTVAPNGLDMGLCQFRVTYFDAFAAEAGLVEWNIMSPIDSIYVYAYMMGKYLDQTGSIDAALSMYYTGGNYYSAAYVQQVRQWEGTLAKIN